MASMKTFVSRMNFSAQPPCAGSGISSAIPSTSTFSSPSISSVPFAIASAYINMSRAVERLRFYCGTKDLLRHVNFRLVEVVVLPPWLLVRIQRGSQISAKGHACHNPRPQSARTTMVRSAPFRAVRSRRSTGTSAPVPTSRPRHFPRPRPRRRLQRPVPGKFPDSALCSPTPRAARSSRA
jgi:hypothetical protein